MSEYICNSIHISPFLERNGIRLSCKEDTIQLFNKETSDLQTQSVKLGEQNTVQLVDSGTIKLTLRNNSTVFIHKIHKNTEFARIRFFHNKEIVAKYGNGTKDCGEYSNCCRQNKGNTKKSTLKNDLQSKVKTRYLTIEFFRKRHVKKPLIRDGKVFIFIYLEQ